VLKSRKKRSVQRDFHGVKGGEKTNMLGNSTSTERVWPEGQQRGKKNDDGLTFEKSNTTKKVDFAREGKR